MLFQFQYHRQYQTCMHGMILAILAQLQKVDLIEYQAGQTKRELLQGIWFKLRGELNPYGFQQVKIV